MPEILTLARVKLAQTLAAEETLDEFVSRARRVRTRLALGEHMPRDRRSDRQGARRVGLPAPAARLGLAGGRLPA